MYLRTCVRLFKYKYALLLIEKFSGAILHIFARLNYSAVFLHTLNSHSCGIITDNERPNTGTQVHFLFSEMAAKSVRDAGEANGEECLI